MVNVHFTCSYMSNELHCSDDYINGNDTFTKLWWNFTVPELDSTQNLLLKIMEVVSLFESFVQNGRQQYMHRHKYKWLHEIYVRLCVTFTTNKSNFIKFLCKFVKCLVRLAIYVDWRKKKDNTLYGCFRFTIPLFVIATAETNHLKNMRSPSKDFKVIFAFVFFLFVLT